MSASDSPTSEEQQSVITKALNISSVPIAIASGLFYANSRIRDWSYNSLRNVGMFNDLIAERTTNAAPLFTAPRDIHADLSALNKSHSEAIAKRIEDYGLSGISKRYKLLHSNQKVEMVVGAMTVSALTLGIVLAAADHKKLFSLVTGGDEQKK